MMEIAAVAVGVAGAVRRGWAGMGMLYRCYMLYVYQGRAKKSPTFTPPWGLSTVEWYKAESNKW